MSLPAAAAAAAYADRAQPSDGNTTSDNIAMVKRLGQAGKTTAGKTLQFTTPIFLEGLEKPVHVLKVRHTASHPPEEVPCATSGARFADLTKRQLPVGLPALMQQQRTTCEISLKAAEAKIAQFDAFLKDPTTLPDFIRRWLEELLKKKERVSSSQQRTLPQSSPAQTAKDAADLTLDLQKALGSHSRAILEAEFKTQEGDRQLHAKFQSLNDEIAQLQQYLRDQKNPLPEFARRHVVSKRADIDREKEKFLECLHRLKAFLESDQSLPALINGIGVVKRCEGALPDFSKIPAVAMTALLPIQENSKGAPFQILRDAQPGDVVLQIAYDDAGTGYGAIALEHSAESSEPIQSETMGHWRDWTAQPIPEDEMKTIHSQTPGLAKAIVNNAVNIFLMRFHKTLQKRGGGGPGASAQTSIITAGSVNTQNYGISDYSGGFEYEPGSALFVRVQGLACRTFALQNSVSRSDPEILSLVDALTNSSETQL